MNPVSEQCEQGSESTDRYYWQVMGMVSDPFAEDGYEPFVSTEWQESLDLLQHLCQYSGLAKVILGQTQCGKSTFLRVFADHTASLLRIFALDQRACTSSEDLIHEIKTRLGLLHETLGQSPRDITHELQKDGLHRVIVIDDAHLLNDEVLHFMEQWVISIAQDGSNFHFVLCGDASLQSRLDASATWTQQITLKPWSTSSVERYLRDRLEKAEYLQPFPFSERELRHIMKASQGWIPAIQQAARVILMDRLVDDQTGSTAWQLWRKPLLGLGAATLVAMALWWTLHRSTAPVHTQETHLPLPLVKTVPGPQMAAQRSADRPLLPLSPRQRLHDSVPVVAAAPVTSSETVAPPQVAIDAVVDDEPMAATPAAVPSNPMVAVVSDEPVAPMASSDQPELPVAAVPSDPMVAVTSDEPASPAVSSDQPELPVAAVSSDPMVAVASDEPVSPSAWSSQEAQLMQWSSQGYTIQILASHQQRKVEAFVNTHRSAHPQLTYVRTHRDGRDWYVVLYGPFRHDVAARSALAQLPSMLKRHRPWLRRLDSVQAQVQASVAIRQRQATSRS